jgi:cytoskeletal protein RodZ
MDIGSQLRQARETRGLTLSALAATTRIQQRVLDAIERNDLSAVPPRPYARGFVATYAREVGLDAANVVHDYFAQFDPALPAPVSTMPVPAALPEQDRRRWTAAVAGIVVLAAVALFVSGRIQQTAREPAAVGTAGVAAVTAADHAAGSANRAAAPGAPPLEAVAAAAGSEPARVRGSTAPPVTAPPLVITLKADAPSWVSATADGTRVLYRTLPRGTTETVRASREITLRVGNAGGLTWSINGREPHAMGATGEVRTFTVTPDQIPAH